VDHALAENYRTADIAAPGTTQVGTVEMGDRISAALG
jgi:hypothetical protein